VSRLDLTHADLSGAAEVGADAVELRLAGSADFRSDAALADLLARVDEEARRAGRRLVRVDLRSLDFMNSSSFKRLISWLLAAQQHPEDQRYAVRLRVRSSVYWQRRSIPAIGLVCGEAVAIDLDDD
jgi:hypothetical protein